MEENGGEGEEGRADGPPPSPGTPNQRTTAGLESDASPAKRSKREKREYSRFSEDDYLVGDGPIPRQPLARSYFPSPSTPGQERRSVGQPRKDRSAEAEGQGPEQLSPPGAHRLPTPERLTMNMKMQQQDGLGKRGLGRPRKNLGNAKASGAQQSTAAAPPEQLSPPGAHRKLTPERLTKNMNMQQRGGSGKQQPGRPRKNLGSARGSGPQQSTAAAEAGAEAEEHGGELTPPSAKRLPELELNINTQHQGTSGGGLGLPRGLHTNGGPAQVTGSSEQDPMQPFAGDGEGRLKGTGEGAAQGRHGELLNSQGFNQAEGAEEAGLGAAAFPHNAALNQDQQLLGDSVALGLQPGEPGAPLQTIFPPGFVPLTTAPGNRAAPALPIVGTYLGSLSAASLPSLGPYQGPPAAAFLPSLGPYEASPIAGALRSLGAYHSRPAAVAAPAAEAYQAALNAALAPVLPPAPEVSGAEEMDFSWINDVCGDNEMAQPLGAGQVEQPEPGDDNAEGAELAPHAAPAEGPQQEEQIVANGDGAEDVPVDADHVPVPGSGTGGGLQAPPEPSEREPQQQMQNMADSHTAEDVPSPSSDAGADPQPAPESSEQAAPVPLMSSGFSFGSGAAGPPAAVASKPATGPFSGISFGGPATAGSSAAQASPATTSTFGLTGNGGFSLPSMATPATRSAGVSPLSGAANGPAAVTSNPATGPFGGFSFGGAAAAGSSAARASSATASPFGLTGNGGFSLPSMATPAASSAGVSPPSPAPAPPLFTAASPTSTSGPSSGPATTCGPAADVADAAAHPAAASGSGATAAMQPTPDGSEPDANEKDALADQMRNSDTEDEGSPEWNQNKARRLATEEAIAERAGKQPYLNFQ